MCWKGSPDSLLDEQAAAFEGALWMALRSLDEKTSLSRRLATSAENRGNSGTAKRYLDVGRNAERASHLIRALIERLDSLGQREPEPEPSG